MSMDYFSSFMNLGGKGGNPTFTNFILSAKGCGGGFGGLVFFFPSVLLFFFFACMPGFMTE